MWFSAPPGSGWTSEDRPRPPCIVHVVVVLLPLGEDVVPVKRVRLGHRDRHYFPGRWGLSSTPGAVICE